VRFAAVVHDFIAATQPAAHDEERVRRLLLRDAA